MPSLSKSHRAEDGVGIIVKLRNQILSSVPRARLIPMLALGMAPSLFLVISYLICIVSSLVLPGLPINHGMQSFFLPGFELLSWQCFLAGLIESFAWGWYAVLIFVPLYNFFALRWR